MLVRDVARLIGFTDGSIYNWVILSPNCPRIWCSSFELIGGLSFSISLSFSLLFDDTTTASQTGQGRVALPSSSLSMSTELLLSIIA